MNTIDWEFAPTGGGDVTGHNDPVTTTFKGEPYHLARESIQNIIDAHNPNSQQPVIAEFTLNEKKADELFLNNTLKKVLNGSLLFNKRKTDAVDFYKSALFKIEHNNFVKVLRISDYNTVGLTGDDNDSDGNYFQLMKAVGDSSKSGNKGGSFGLGKGAYYAASSYRTIFVSSKYGDNNYVFQGKARLSSFVDESEKMMQGNGSFGLSGQKPVRDNALIPDIFKRDDMGTDFYIIGFNGEDDWQKEMMKSILNYFWYTISKGQLEVTIDGITVTRTNLELLLKEYFDENQPDKVKDPNPWPYYLAFTSNEHIIFEDNLPVLGKVKLYVLLRDDFPQKVVYMRQTGMVIQKKGKNSVNGYAAVFVCEDEFGNSILRKMENPEHNEWNKENAMENTAYFEKAKEVEKELTTFIVDSIKKLTDSNTPTSARIGNLEDYLYLPGDRDIGSTSAGYSGQPINEISSTETGNLINKIGEEILVPTPIIKRIESVKEKNVSGIVGGNLPIIRDKHKGNGGIGTGGTEGKGEVKLIILNTIKFRSFASRNQEGKIEHVVLLKGPIGKKCVIEVKAGTDESFDSLTIIEAKNKNGLPLKVTNNFIKGISIDNKGLAELYVRFASEDKYSLNVTAYEDK